MVGSAAYSATSATVVAMAKGDGKGKGVRGGASAGTNKVGPIPLPDQFEFCTIGFGAIVWSGTVATMQRGGNGM